MLKNRCILFLLILVPNIFHSVISSSQIPKMLPVDREYTIRSWTVASGVPPILYTIAQSPEGYLLLGSDQGAYRFDGIKLVPLDADSMKADNECRDILVLHDSSLLCGFKDGKLVRYNKEGGSILYDPGIFRNETITSLILMADGSVWAGTDGAGLFRFHDGGFTGYSVKDGLPSDHITALATDSTGKLCVGTQEGLAVMDTGDKPVISELKGLSRDFVLSLCQDSGGRLWIGTHGGLNVLEGGTVRSIVSEILTLEADITAITEDNAGDIWFASNGEGLYRIHPPTSEIHRITERQGLPSNLIKSLFVDREATIWAGFDANFGLCQLQKRVISFYTAQDGLSGNNTLALYRDAGNRVWIGNATGGVDCYSKGSFVQHTRAADLGSRPVFTICSDREGTIWIGSKDSLVLFNGEEKTGSVRLKSPEQTEYHAILAASDGSVWIGSNWGIYILRGQDTIKLGLREGLSSDMIFCLAEDIKGAVWIGTQDGGLNRYYKGEITNYTKNEGLPDDLVLCLYADPQGILWIGTAAGGLCRMDTETGKITTFGKQEGLELLITQIVEDDWGYLWIGTFDDIISVKKDALNAAALGGEGMLSVKEYPCSDSDHPGGLNAGIFPPGCRLNDGTIWFPANSGIVAIHPERSHGEALFPDVIIESVVVNSVPQPLQPSYTFPPGVIHLEIDFTAPTFISPERIRFRYKLEGYDDDWVTCGSSRKAYYTRVPFGSYKFNVQAANHLGQWSDESCSIQIRIKPYFYQRIWFILICISGGLFSLYFIYKYRIRQIREKKLEILVDARTKELTDLNRELDQRVLDRTAELAAANQELEAFTYSVSHDLRAPVRRIEGLVDALTDEYSYGLDETGRDYLQKVRDSSKDMGLLIEEFLKLARIARQEIDKTELDLSRLVTEIMDELRSADPDRSITLSVEPGIMATGDPRLIRIALFNMLTNAWKYTGREPKPEITFNCRTDDGQKVYSIRDNGVGFDMGHYEKLFTPFMRLHSDDQFTGTGIGLATVKRIILKHGGRIWARSEPGKGSTFYFTL